MVNAKTFDKVDATHDRTDNKCQTYLHLQITFLIATVIFYQPRNESQMLQI